MKIFKVDKRISIICRAESTRSGFRHLATLMLNNYERRTFKACYINRTWERYQFESVLYHLADKTEDLTDVEKKKLIKKIKTEFF